MKLERVGFQAKMVLRAYTDGVRVRTQNLTHASANCSDLSALLASVLR